MMDGVNSTMIYYKNCVNVTVYPPSTIMKTDRLKIKEITCVKFPAPGSSDA
jgi:hypothetical protein